MKSCIILGFAALVFLGGGLQPSAATAVTIDFESFSPGAQPSNFLAAFGIESVTDDRSDSDFFIQDFTTSPHIVVPSGKRAFVPAGGSYPSPTGYFNTTLTFSVPVTDFSFAKIADTSGTFGIAGWRAQAFDGGGGLVDSVEKNLAGGLDFPSPPPNQQFMLQGAAPIKSIVFATHYSYQSTHGSVPVDDFQFHPIPEPSSFIILSLLGVLAIAFGCWRRKRLPAP